MGKKRKVQKLTAATFVCLSPDNKERVTGTLVLATGAGAAPKVNTGHTVTRLMLFSSANLQASFSKSTFETAYPYNMCKHGTTLASRHLFIRKYLCETE